MRNMYQLIRIGYYSLRITFKYVRIHYIYMRSNYKGIRKRGGMNEPRCNNIQSKNSNRTN